LLYLSFSVADQKPNVLFLGFCLGFLGGTRDTYEFGENEEGEDEEERVTDCRGTAADFVALTAETKLPRLLPKGRYDLKIR
jgi:hypothetical protein